MKKNNLGFTLVELIASVAILGIIALGAAGFLMTGTRSYTNVSYLIRLQYESQLVMNQIQNYAMNSNSGLAWDGTNLYVLDGGKTGTVFIFKYDDADDRLLFGSGQAAAQLGSVDADKIVAEHVAGVTVSCVKDSENLASSVRITLQMSMGGREYEAAQTIALRNQPYYETNWGSLWNDVK